MGARPGPIEAGAALHLHGLMAGRWGPRIMPLPCWRGLASLIDMLTCKSVGWFGSSADLLLDQILCPTGCSDWLSAGLRQCFCLKRGREYTHTALVSSAAVINSSFNNGTVDDNASMNSQKDRRKVSYILCHSPFVHSHSEPQGIPRHVNMAREPRLVPWSVDPNILMRPNACC